jgi:Cyclin-dependent kinase inhibitor 3 (CDKN3)
MTERARDAWQPPAEWRTSGTEPYAVDWVDLRGVPGLADTDADVDSDAAVAGDAVPADGRLGMSFAPGKYDPLGKHDRDLAADVERLRAVHRVDALLLLVDDDEMSRMHITELPEALGAAGVALLRHPIPDFGVPQDQEVFAATVEDVLTRVRGGQRVAVACFGGFGRTGTVTGCVLRAAGVQPKDAVSLVRATRPGTIERDSQVAFVEAFSG